MPETDTSWQALSVDEALKQLDTDAAKGLAPEEASKRLEEHGPNALIEKPGPSFLARLWNQLNQFLVLILIVSAIVSGIIGWSQYRQTAEFTELIDAIAIMAIVVLNSVLGMVQEGKAEQALAKLKKMAAPNAQVVRGGHLLVVPARELVLGDIVVLESGNYVPTDLRLIETVNLSVEEASLTGESVPVEKDAAVVLPEDTHLADCRNCGYMSTIVTYGRGRGVVTATAMGTELGKIATLIQETEEEPTPLQVKLGQLGRTLGVATLVICGLVGVIGVVRDTPITLLLTDGLATYFSTSQSTLIELFMIAVSLAIAAVPEGLPAVVTISLALGMQEMIDRHALIRHLPAVETLGSATTICSDKTGTLTQNQMTIKQVYADDTLIHVSGQGYEPIGEFSVNSHQLRLQNLPGLSELSRAAVLCNDAVLERSENGDEAWGIVGDPTEGALVVLAAKAGLWRQGAEAEYPRIDEVPFDSSRKRMTTIHRKPGGELVAYAKGAPDLLVELCDRIHRGGEVEPMTPHSRQDILDLNEAMASNALRILGLASRPLDSLPSPVKAETIERNLIFIGLVGMIDPARPEVHEAIAVARRAGIATVMVTGDHRNTAVAIARELELLRRDDQVEDHVLTGAQLDQMSDEELTGLAEDIKVYARVSPEHKVRIVEALKRRDQVVAMTGDGVNDAPALKRASIGIAMGITGTDVTRETADMVLTDDNYASIVAAVEEGRIIFSNIRKFVYYLISCNMAEIMVLFLAMLLNWGLPLTAIQLLILNLVTDGAPALALGMEKGDPDIMEQTPRPTREPIINGPMIWGTVVQTLAITGSVLTAFLIGRSWYGTGVVGLQRAQTMAFVTLTVSELLRAYTARSERYALVKIGIFSNRFMQWAVLISLVVLFATVYLPFLSTSIFRTQPLSLQDWGIVTPLLLVPAIAAEIYKAFLLRRERGVRRAAQ